MSVSRMASSAPTTMSACEKSSDRVSSCGTATVKRPAATAAETPCGESSTATDCIGSAPSCAQANRYEVGSGLDGTSSLRPTTHPKRSLSPSRARCASTHATDDEDATPTGTPRSSASAAHSRMPGRTSYRAWSVSLRARRCSLSVGSRGAPKRDSRARHGSKAFSMPRVRCQSARARSCPCAAHSSAQDR